MAETNFFSQFDKPAEAPQASDGRNTFAKYDAPKEEKPGYLTSLARGDWQGVSMGTADESYGLTQGVLSLLSGGTFREGYNRGLKQYRANDEAAKEANPITYAVGEAGGTIVPLAAGGATAVGAQALGLTGGSLAARTVASAASGGVISGVQGFNNGEGGFEARYQNAKLPFFAGLGLGAVSPTIGLGVGKVVNTATRSFLGRGSVPPGMTGATADMLADDFARAGGSPAVTSRLAELGPDAMLLDASPSLTGRAQGLAIQPETREGIVAPLMARDRATNARLNADFDAAIGPAPVPSQIEAGLAASRDATAEGYVPVMRGARRQKAMCQSCAVLARWIRAPWLTIWKRPR